MSTHDGADFTPNTILFFEANASAPSAFERKILEQWLARWRAQPKAKKLVIGGALDTPRAGRLRRLHAILSILKDMGVSLRAIQPVEDWFRPSRMGMTEVLPADMAWIGLSEASCKPAAADQTTAEAHAAVPSKGV